MKKHRFLLKIANFAGRLAHKIASSLRKKVPKKSLARKRPARTQIQRLPALFEDVFPPIEPAKRNFFEAADEFSSIQLSAHTKRAYSGDLRGFFAYALTKGVKSTNWNTTFSPKLIADYRDWMVGEQKLSKTTATRRLAVVKSFFKWARATQLLDRDPAELVRSFPQNQESKTGYLNRAQIHKLLGDFYATSDTGLFRSLSRVVVETLLMLGLRRSEATAIRLGDLSYVHAEWFLRVKGKGDRERLLPLPPKLLTRWSQWLRRLHDDFPSLDLDQSPAECLHWMQNHRDWPLLRSTKTRDPMRAISSSEIAHIVRKASRRAGIINRVTPHMLRATAITFALDEGASHRGVQQMAGWTSPLMISRYDKRLKDPKFSGLRHLKYAFEGWDSEEETTQQKAELAESPPIKPPSLQKS